MKTPDITIALSRRSKERLKEKSDKVKSDAAMKRVQDQMDKINKRNQDKEGTEVEVTASPLPKNSDPFIARWEAQLVVTENEVEKAKIKARIAKRQKKLDKKKK